jgi:lipid A 3-O-deacylase
MRIARPIPIATQNRAPSACGKLFPDVILFVQMNSRIILALFFFTFLVLGAASGAESAASNADKSEVKPWVRKVAFGILLHDVGPISDQRENGVDPNWELQFNRPEWKWWRWVGSPFPMVGATPNFNGDTSAFYVGIAYEFSLSNDFTDELTYNLTKTLWASGGVSAAVHTGPLHKNETDCKVDNDCGFGYRVIPRIYVEFGSYFRKDHGLSLFLDHMSRRGVGSAKKQNEGIDHFGIRYHFIFNKNSSP